ncbi:hypothetical protein LPMP_090580 [Leishmania panamensis]|uniref:CULT domain-containing protein n=1 Tax=Leishmania panamensis TaxID=5679 RepID=A0A088RLA5_LEIPA|nr:hypothetical protein LPMP_090580 [Leishmania panamensis]AIN95974.1 hypothetical protein LPMP_090580 [Leishmania panamensis]
MSASPPSLSTATASVAPRPPDTIAALLCDNCRCPIGSLWDVLPAEAAVPAWREQVYSYELDLFADGSPPIQAYSATNPNAHRFDLLRLTPYVTVHRASAPSSAAPPLDVGASQAYNRDTSTTVAAPLDAEKCEGPVQVEDASTAPAQPADATGPHDIASTTLHAPPFVECDTCVYSSEHSFFSGYAWCFCTCGNCGAFLGWGFAALDRLHAAQRLRRGDKSGSISETSNDNRIRKKGARQEEEVRQAEAEIDTAAATSSSQPAESNSAPVVLTARSLDQHQQSPCGEDEPCRSSAHASDLSPPHDSNDDDSDEYTSATTVTDSNGSDDSNAIGGSGHHRGGQMRISTGVAPDFIGIIITHCTGEPDYPIASLIREVEWRTARQRRHKRVQALTRHLRALLPQVRDSYHAHEIYHNFHTMEQLLYATPIFPLPRTSGGSAATVTALLSDVDEDGVPISMHAAVEAARIAVARQMNSDNSRDVNGSGCHSSSHEGDDSS